MVSIQAEYKNKTGGKRTLVSGHLVSWEASAAFPLAQIRASLGQAGELATEIQVRVSKKALHLSASPTESLPQAHRSYCTTKRGLSLQAMYELSFGA